MTNDLLPCPFCGTEPTHNHKDGMVFCAHEFCCAFRYRMDDRQWNTRTPNKPAEVDLDGLKSELSHQICYGPDNECSHCTVIRQAVDYLAASGHLATGKGGGEPAAPTQIDAGELERAVDHCESVCNTSTRNLVLVPDEEFWLILKAARAHLEKLKGGV